MTVCQKIDYQYHFGCQLTNLTFSLLFIIFLRLIIRLHMEFSNSSSNQSRVILLGNKRTPAQYYDNSVFTAKYTVFSFLPKALILQFLRLSNIVFLANAILQSISIISSLSPLTAVAPLCFVLLVSLAREAYEDCKRHSNDQQINSRKTTVLRGEQFYEVQWKQVKVGDYVKVKNHQIIPCDILLLCSSEENSMCYVQTAKLDGQNNLKEKFAFTNGIKKFPHEFQSLAGQCNCDFPKQNLHQFDGTLHIDGNQKMYIGIQNLLLRQTTLKNTDEIVGLAIYCGKDSKVLKNQGQIPHKVSQIQAKLNYIQIGLVIVLGFICGSCSLGYSLIHSRNHLRSSNSYIPLQGLSLSIQSGLDFLTTFLLLNFLIPISLVILIQAIKTFSGVFLTMDKKLQDQEAQASCRVLNCSLIEELGVIDLILTDKTGTLTANQMLFQKIAISNRIYLKQDLERNVQRLPQDSQLNYLMFSLVICHQVVKDQVKDEYQGSSPDQVCFVNFMKTVGYQFMKRSRIHIQISIMNQKKVYNLVDILKFDGRKRMSVAIQDLQKPDQVIIFTKGADDQIFKKSCPFPFFRDLSKSINDFAREGLRTLVFASRKLPLKTYQEFIESKTVLKSKLLQKRITKSEYNERINYITQQIQSQLTILGATGIQDKLQQQVPQTIQRLKRAGIIVMMITGDKLETAQNIGYLSRLIQQDYQVYRLHSNETRTPQICYNLLSKHYHQNFSLIIEGNQISKITTEKNERIIKVYSQVFLKAKSVIFCRSSPKQKAEIAKFLKTNLKIVILAIGDGGNDVGMIEQAHIGVGIIGKQGNSAAAVSDFSFAKFKLLDRLLLHHGRWFYYRLSYFFTFYGWKNTVITFMMYFSNTFNSFSGIINFTQSFYTLFNSFFAVIQTINFGLYQQDINDDLQVQIKQYLPQIYKQTKEQDLFSIKRYLIWNILGIIGAFLAYFFLIESLSPLQAVDQSGRVADQTTQRLANGIALSLIVMIINYMDTKSHTFLFEVIIFWIGSILLTAVFFLAENYLQFLQYYQCYRDNMNARFWLVIFVVVLIFVLFKMAVQAYCFQFSPMIIDSYKRSKHNGTSFDKFMKERKFRQMPLQLQCLQNKEGNIKSDDQIKFNPDKLRNNIVRQENQNKFTAKNQTKIFQATTIRFYLQTQKTRKKESIDLAQTHQI